MGWYKIKAKNMNDYMSLTTGLVHIGCCSSIDVTGTDPSLRFVFSHEIHGDLCSSYRIKIF